MRQKNLSAKVGCAVLAAVALTAASTASAHHRPGHNPPGHSKGHDGPQSIRGGGPPPWAPAWGYRGKNKFRYWRNGVAYEAWPDSLIRLPEIGIGRCSRDIIGAVLGGAVGAAAGSQIGKGDGRTLATIGGAIIGVLVGGNIGRAMDQVDQNCVGQVLERTPPGRTVVWEDPDRHYEYAVMPARTWQAPGGAYCREYQMTVTIAGKVENAHGTACRQPDGSWKKI